MLPTSSEGFLQEPEMFETIHPVSTKYSQILTVKSFIIVTPSVVSELGGLDVLGQFIIIPFFCSADVL